MEKMPPFGTPSHLFCPLSLCWAGPTPHSLSEVSAAAGSIPTFPMSFSFWY